MQPQKSVVGGWQLQGFCNKKSCGLQTSCGGILRQAASSRRKSATRSAVRNRQRTWYGPHLCCKPVYFWPCLEETLQTSDCSGRRWDAYVLQGRHCSVRHVYHSVAERIILQAPSSDRWHRQAYTFTAHRQKFKCANLEEGHVCTRVEKMKRTCQRPELLVLVNDPVLSDIPEVLQVSTPSFTYCLVRKYSSWGAGCSIAVGALGVLGRIPTYRVEQRFGLMWSLYLHHIVLSNSPYLQVS